MKMIRRLQLKFMCIVLIIITLLLGGVIFTLNISMRKIGDAQMNRVMDELINSDGGKPRNWMQPFESNKAIPPMEPTVEIKEQGNKTDNFYRKLPFDILSMRTQFCVKMNREGKLLQVASQFPVHYTDLELASLLEGVKTQNEDRGVITGLRYRVVEKEYGFLVVFVDRRVEDNMLYRFLEMSLITYSLTLFVVLIITWFLSRWAVQPVKTAFIKQKQFVADASHELKTPLSVISTNIDVIEGQVGTNKWFGYIKDEVQRMSTLVKDLLYLAKCDSNEILYEFKEFNLSRAMYSATLPFESVIYEKGLDLQINIEPDLMYLGDESHIKQIAIIFIDNAIKNTKEKGQIIFTLKNQGSKKYLSVYNTGDGLDQSELKKVFERFYRSDVSRTRDTGGSGLGLSIAATIAEAHKAKIGVTSEKGKWIEFYVNF
jgi:signal transduction histidine kinase